MEVLPGHTGSETLGMSPTVCIFNKLIRKCQCTNSRISVVMYSLDPGGLVTPPILAKFLWKNNNKNLYKIIDLNKEISSTYETFLGWAENTMPTNYVHKTVTKIFCPYIFFTFCLLYSFNNALKPWLYF